MTSEERELLIQLNKRVEQLEFRESLIIDGSNTSRILLDYNITHPQYIHIMDIMDEYREKISKNEEVNSALFETKILNVVNEGLVTKDIRADYHFCEYIAKSFMEDGRWSEVFPALYGDSPKYQ